MNAIECVQNGNTRSTCPWVRVVASLRSLSLQYCVSTTWSTILAVPSSTAANLPYKIRSVSKEVRWKSWTNVLAGSGIEDERGVVKLDTPRLGGVESRILLSLSLLRSLYLRTIVWMT